MKQKWTEAKVRRYVRRHAKLTKVSCWKPWTYVEATVVIKYEHYGETFTESLMCPGFAKCMMRDDYDRLQGIVNAWMAAYESLVDRVVLFYARTGPTGPRGPSCCVEKKEPPKPAVSSQKELRKRLKAKLAEQHGGITIHERLVRFVDTWTQAGDEIRKGLAVCKELMFVPDDCEENLEETEDLLAICERADEPTVEFEEAVNAIEETDNG